MRYITNEMLKDIQNAPSLIHVDKYPVTVINGQVRTAVRVRGRTVVECLEKLPFPINKTTRILCPLFDDYDSDDGIGEMYYLAFYEIK
jgi:hypothetical protein